METDNANGPIALPSLRDEVYNIIRKRILTHVYPPGYRFNLAEFEAQLGVSLTPLKEALHRLQAEGLVEIRPRRGTFVTSIDPADVAESFDVRCILECAAAELVVPTITGAEITELQAMHSRMQALLEQGVYAEIVAEHIDLDRKLHKRFIELTRNRRLIAIYGQIDTHLQVARVQSQFRLEDSYETRREHEAFIEALTRRDVAATKRALTVHADLSKRRMLKVLNSG
ncbi:MAG: GntR family transcriptional regulator [Caldilineaceae bacterium]|nr:GntR family transcriptional regulator [Caldilineaceae bacterium]